jgi:hypothetical protein
MKGCGGDDTTRVVEKPTVDATQSCSFVVNSFCMNKRLNILISYTTKLSDKIFE